VTIGFITNKAIAGRTIVDMPVNMQMGVLPVHIEKQKPARPRGTFALTGTTSALLYP
jgi:hypothetical protein